MAKEEECRQCTKCKVGSYGALKCSFYGRLPEFNDSSCPKFTQSDAPIEIKKVKHVVKESMKEVKEGQPVMEQEEPEGPLCYHGTFAGDVYPEEEKVYKEEKKKKTWTPAVFLVFLLFLIILRSITGSSHRYSLYGEDYVMLMKLSMFFLFVYLAYIYVFYKVWKISQPFKEQLQPFYRSVIKINTGSIVTRLLIFQILFAVTTISRFVLALKSSPFESAYDWMAVLSAVFLLLFLINMVFFAIRLFQLKKKSFAYLVSFIVVVLLLMQIAVPLMEEPASVFIIIGFSCIIAIYGSSALIRKAEEAFGQDETQEDE